MVNDAVSSLASSFVFPPLGSDTKEEVKKNASLRIPREAVGFAVKETRREASAMRRLCKVSSMEISYVSLGDRFAAIWFGVQLVVR